MSESTTFANYANTAQRLAQSVSQQQASTQQVMDDKGSFEQQFFSGAAVNAKTMATEKILGLFSKSKAVAGVKQAAGNAKAAAVEGANGLATRAQSKVKKLVTDFILPKVDDSVPPPPPGTGGSTKAQMQAGSRQGLARAKGLLQRGLNAPDISSPIDDIAKLVNSSRTGAPATQLQAAAQAGRDALQAGQDAADAAPKIVGAAEEAARIGQSAAGAGSKIAGDLVDLAPKAEEAAGDLAKAAKVEKIVKDGDEVVKASEAGDEDPLVAVATLAGAGVLQLIGRSVKAHTQLDVGTTFNKSFSVTPGA